jgi:hypothetical protein
MRESMWGIFIITLGAVGIIAINLFQSLTVTNDQTYYLMKEATRASMGDSIDLSYYKTTGKLRIVEEKFVENFTRRFAESAAFNKDYNIVIHDVVEEPPKVSLSIVTNAVDMKGEKYNVVQKIDSIYEAIYKRNMLYDEKYFEDYENIIGKPGTVPEEIYKDGKCPNANSGIDECISGDLQFLGWETIPAFNDQLCPQDLVKLRPEDRDAEYRECVCGKWDLPKKEIVNSGNPVIGGGKAVYTWKFNKNGPVNNIDTSIKSEVVAGVCTRGLNLLIKDDLPGTLMGGIECPPEGIFLVKGQTQRIYPRYIPKESINRKLTWEKSNEGISIVQQVGSIYYPNKDYVDVTGKYEGESVVKSTTSNGISATCKVTVYDVDKLLTCPPGGVTIPSGAHGMAILQNNVSVPGMTYSISNSNIAKINQNGKIITTANLNAEANITYTISVGGKSVNCPLKVTASNDKVATIYPSGSNSCTVGSIQRKKWNINPSRVCAFHIEFSEATFMALALSGSNLEIRKCSVNTPFESCGSGVWDSTQSIPLSVSSGKNFIVTKSISNYNKSSGNYNISVQVRVNHVGWQPDLIARNCRSMNLYETFNYEVSGKALSNETEYCQNLKLDDSLLTRSMEGAAMSCDAPIPGFKPSSASLSFASLEGDKVIWEKRAGGELINLNKTTGKDITMTAVKGLGGGDVTLMATVRDKNNTKVFEKTCDFTVSVDACSVLSLTSSKSCIKTDQSAWFSVSDGSSSFLGNSIWTWNSNYLNPKYSSDVTSTDNVMHFVAKDVGTATTSVSVRRQAKCITSGNYVSDSVTIDIHPKGDYYCPSENYPVLISNNRCTNLFNMERSGKPPTCSSNQVSYDGKCYNQSDMPDAAYIPPKCPSGSTLMCAGGSSQGCSSYFCGTTEKSKVCPNYTLSGTCYKSRDSVSLQECRADGGTFSNKYCYFDKQPSSVKVCPSGTTKSADGKKCYNTVEIDDAYYECKKGYQTGYMIYNKCIFNTTPSVEALDCTKYGANYGYDTVSKQCLPGIPAVPNNC